MVMGILFPIEMCLLFPIFFGSFLIVEGAPGAPRYAESQRISVTPLNVAETS